MREGILRSIVEFKFEEIDSLRGFDHRIDLDDVRAELGVDLGTDQTEDRIEDTLVILLVRDGDVIGNVREEERKRAKHLRKVFRKQGPGDTDQSGCHFPFRSGAERMGRQ